MNKIDYSKPVQFMGTATATWMDVVLLFKHGSDEPSYFKHVEDYYNAIYPITPGTILRNTPPRKVKKEGWVNVYRGLMSEIHATKEKALERTTGCTIDTIRIEWEEEE